MPRRSSASFAIPILPGASERLRPPVELTQDERAVFISIVSDCKPTHFKPSDLPLLCAYVRAVLAEREASAKLETEGRVIDNKLSPWVAVWAMSHKSMLAFARQLRLSPLARGPNNTGRPGKPEASLSYYETMALGEDS